MLNVESTLGAILIGVVVHSGIYGIVLLQMFNYFSKYSSNDRLYLKALVIVTWLLVTLHLICFVDMLYHYTILSFGNIVKLTMVHWSMQLSAAAGAVHVLLTQSFYGYRIYRLSGGNVWIPILIFMVSLSQLGNSLAWSIKAFRAHSVPELLLAVEDVGIAALACDIAANTIITMSMIVLLIKNRSPFRGNNRMIDALLSYTIRTCLLALITSATAVGLLVRNPMQFKFAPPYQLAVVLYANALLSTLNNRQILREKLAPSGRAFNSDCLADSTQSASVPEPASRFAVCASKGTVSCDDRVLHLPPGVSVSSGKERADPSSGKDFSPD